MVKFQPLANKFIRHRFFFDNDVYSSPYPLYIYLALNLLTSGCTSEAPRFNPTPIAHTSHPQTRAKAAYNRPYTVKGKTYYPMSTATGYSEQGIASWYGYESGNRTSMGTHFKPQAHTAAHKTLPLPSKVRVTNLHNGRSIIVTVNDRGPFKKNRLIDLSQAAAKKIGLDGLGRVHVEYVGDLSEND